MNLLLALDAGGSTTRALVLTPEGELRGRGTAGPGNPTAVGAERALAAIREASGQALDGQGPVVGAVLATAGSERAVGTDLVREALGLPDAAGFRRVSDLLAMYFSAVDAQEGAALIAGTGSVAARVRDRELQRVAGGNGWLIGDGGSGFWIARRVLRAVTADLDGIGPRTTLTARVLRTLGLTDERRTREGRPYVLGELVDLVYAQQPVHLARLAPDCFAAAAQGDAVAAGIVEAAAEELAVLVRAVEGPGPIVVGGSVWRRGFARPAASLARALEGRQIAPADDGLLGAAVLALHERGRPTDVLRTRFTALAAE